MADIYLGNLRLRSIPSVTTGNNGSGRNVGDIFYSTRLDSILNGASPCDGSSFNTSDFTGTDSIGELLISGMIPYVSISTYDATVLAHGSCRCFGWDGLGTTTFKVPTLTNVFIESGVASSSYEFIAAGLPNITGGITGTHIRNNVGSYGCGYGAVVAGANRYAYTGSYQETSGTGNWSFDASRSSSIYGNSTTVQPQAVKYRAFIQLFNSATDTAVTTCGSVLSDISDLKNGSNFTASGKESIASISVVDYSTVITSITFPYTSLYTGRIYVKTYGQDGNYPSQFFVNGEEVYSRNISGSGGRVGGWFDVSIGDVVTYVGSGIIEIANFYKLKGSA